jgi:hypothetical protein
MARKRQRRTVSEAEVEATSEQEAPEAEATEEVPEAEAPATKAKTKTKTVKREEAEAPAPEAEKETTRKREPRGEAVTDEPVEVDAAGLVQALLEGLAEGGKPVLVTPAKGGAFLVSQADVVPVKATSKKGYKEEDYWSDEYAEFRSWWTPMTAEQKEEYAAKEKVTWDVHDQPLVNNIRLSEAVQAKLGINKYKPGFEERNARILGVPAS